MIDRNFVIYKITNCINGKVYIGKTSRTAETRWRQHVSHSKQCQWPMARAIRKYGESNFKMELMHWNISSNDDANQFEEFCIWLCKSNQKKYGYNLTSGGDGIVGYKFSEEIKQARRVRMAGPGNPMFGVRHSEEFKAYLSSISSGVNNKMFGQKRPDLALRNKARAKPKIPIIPKKRIHTEETKCKISRGNLGKRRSSEAIARCITSKAGDFKPVIGIHIKTSTALSFSSLGEASRHGFDKSCISRCAKGRVKTHRGYVWSFAEGT
jgi:group I intron endonuclease